MARTPRPVAAAHAVQMRDYAEQLGLVGPELGLTGSARREGGAGPTVREIERGNRVGLD